MDDKTLRQTHPQKHYLKYICTLLYYFGFGDCWYEESAPLPLYRQILYEFWRFVAGLYAYLGVINEYCAYFRTNLSVKDENDLLQFCLAHFTICGKITLMVLYKNRIKGVMQRFFDLDNRILDIDVEKASVRKAMMYGAAFGIGCYVTMFATLADGIAMHYKEGVPIHTEVTYYPESDDTVGCWILRFFVEVHWWFVVTLMVLVDSFTAGWLVFLAAKFQLLQKYFEGLKEKFLKNPDGKTQEELEEEYLEALVDGFKKHEHTLWCTRKVQYALGNVYSIQLVESITLIVMCLIKLVRNERNMTFLLANFAYLIIIVVQTGVYMMVAGDITWEASRVQTSIFYSGWEMVQRRSRRLRTLVVVALIRSQVPVQMTAFGIYTLSYSNFILASRVQTSIFYSGWEMVQRRSRRLRTLVVVALIRSQVPVQMTAFGIYTLSYSNFILVLRTSYSFFAVTY